MRHYRIRRLLTPFSGLSTMSDNPTVQRAARLLQNMLEDVCLDQLEMELDEEHPTDSDEFIADLTTGRLTPGALADFRQHLRGCLLCGDVVDSLREHYPLTELTDEHDADLENTSPATVVPLISNEPSISTAATLPASETPAGSLEQARQLLTTIRRNESTGPATRFRLQRTIAVVAAIAAVLVLVPALRVMLQPEPMLSTFATVATLADFGLTSDVRGRDLTPPGETETRKAETLRTELQQQPDDPIARLNLAAQLLKNRQLDEARTLIEAVLENRPGDPTILNALALVQIASNESQTAILTLQKAVESKPLFTPAVLNLADLLVERQQSAEAVSALRQALQSPLPTDERELLKKRLDSLSNLR